MEVGGGWFPRAVGVRRLVGGQVDVRMWRPALGGAEAEEVDQRVGPAGVRVGGGIPSRIEERVGGKALGRTDFHEVGEGVGFIRRDIGGDTAVPGRVEGRVR